MAIQTLSYAAADVVINFGPIELEGSGDGTFVVVEYDVEAVKKTVGAQGHVCAVISSNDGGKLKWTASQSSPVNDRLAAIAAAQRKPGNGLIKYPLSLKHFNGTTLMLGPEAWIMKEPGAEFADDHKNREWNFDIAHMTLFVGSSTR